MTRVLIFLYSDFEKYTSELIKLFFAYCNYFWNCSQIYVAYQNGRVDQALSLGFLLGWIAGDLTNFIGCYLTNQLPIQVICQYSYFFTYPFQTVCLNSEIT